MAGALINVERIYEEIVALYPALESLGDEQLDRAPTWASTRERFKPDREDGLRLVGPRPHAHLGERRPTAGEWVPDELEAQMHVRGAGLAFGARLRRGGAASRDGLCVQVRLARGVPSLAIPS
jgi:hypothetical protein